MSIDLNKLVNNFNDVKIEVGLFGGRTLVYENTRFKMNQLVKQLVEEKKPLSHETLKKLENINHALPDDISFVQKVLTTIRQFFGNLSYNRDTDLFKLSILYRKIQEDRQHTFLRPVDLKPIAAKEEPDELKKGLKPLNNEEGLSKIVFPQKPKAEEKKPDSILKTKSKVNIPPEPTPLVDAKPSETSGSRVKFPEEEKTSSPKPKLQRTKSLSMPSIIQELKELNDLPTMQHFFLYNEFAKVLENIDTREHASKIELAKNNAEKPFLEFIEKICGYKAKEAFDHVESRKILVFTIKQIVIFNSSFIVKEKALLVLHNLLPNDAVIDILKIYINYVVDVRKYKPDSMDKTFEYLLNRYFTLRDQNPSLNGLDQDSLSIAVASSILSDQLTPKWVLNLIDRFKKDKELLTKIDAILAKVCKERYQTYGDKLVIQYLESLNKPSL